MARNQLGVKFTSHLHATHLKPAGFRKIGATSVRPRTGYMEMYNIQGSDWNSAGNPWKFYLNVLVRLDDLGPLQGHRATPTYYHANARSNRIIEKSPADFSLTDRSMEAVAAGVAEIIFEITELISDMLPPVRERALTGLYSPLPVPASWLGANEV